MSCRYCLPSQPASMTLPLPINLGSLDYISLSPQHDLNQKIQENYFFKKNQKVFFSRAFEWLNHYQMAGASLLLNEVFRKVQNNQTLIEPALDAFQILGRELLPLLRIYAKDNLNQANVDHLIFRLAARILPPEEYLNDFLFNEDYSLSAELRSELIRRFYFDYFRQAEPPFSTVLLERLKVYWQTLTPVKIHSFLLNMNTHLPTQKNMAVYSSFYGQNLFPAPVLDEILRVTLWETHNQKLFNFLLPFSSNLETWGQTIFKEIDEIAIENNCYRGLSSEVAATTTSKCETLLQNFQKIPVGNRQTFYAEELLIAWRMAQQIHNPQTPISADCVKTILFTGDRLKSHKTPLPDFQKSLPPPQIGAALEKITSAETTEGLFFIQEFLRPEQVAGMKDETAFWQRITLQNQTSDYDQWQKANCAALAYFGRQTEQTQARYYGQIFFENATEYLRQFEHNNRSSFLGNSLLGETTAYQNLLTNFYQKATTEKEVKKRNQSLMFAWNFAIATNDQTILEQMFKNNGDILRNHRQTLWSPTNAQAVIHNPQGLTTILNLFTKYKNMRGTAIDLFLRFNQAASYHTLWSEKNTRCLVDYLTKVEKVGLSTNHQILKQLWLSIPNQATFDFARRVVKHSFKTDQTEMDIYYEAAHYLSRSLIHRKKGQQLLK